MLLPFIYTLENSQYRFESLKGLNVWTDSKVVSDLTINSRIRCPCAVFVIF